MNTNNQTPQTLNRRNGPPRESPLVSPGFVVSYSMIVGEADADGKVDVGVQLREGVEASAAP